jgi:hypothetical protein
MIQTMMKLVEGDSRTCLRIGPQGRHSKAQGTALGYGNHETLKPCKGDKPFDRWFRPFRAWNSLESHTQGCALGFRVSALRAKGAKINLSPNIRIGGDRRLPSESIVC